MQCLELDQISLLRYLLLVDISLIPISSISKQLSAFFAILKEVSSFNLLFANFFKLYQNISIQTGQEIIILGNLLLALYSTLEVMLLASPQNVNQL